MSGPNRIDPTGMRISTNLTIDRQTPKTDFGDRVKAGLDTAAGAIANGVAVAAPLVPGGAIISAAVSSLGTLSKSGGGAMSAQYAATGAVSVGGGAGAINTTVGGGGMPGVGSVGGGVAMGGGAPGFMPAAVGQAGVPGGMMGQMNGGLTETASQLGQMLQVQMQVQRENQVFTTVSNVLKTRHDTVKNTISNVR